MSYFKAYVRDIAQTIGRLEDAAAIVRGEAGTYVEAGGTKIDIRRQAAKNAATSSVN